MPAYERHFAGLSRDEAVAQGQRHGVPTAALLTLAEVAGQRALRGAGGVRLGAGGPGGGRTASTVRVPDGLVEIDGRRAGLRGRRRPPGSTRPRSWGRSPAGSPRPMPAGTGARSGRWPGVRVLDLGVIVVGAELGRLLADLGAEVIKVENRAFPDGSRQSLAAEAHRPASPPGTATSRSLGLNLRDPRGKDAVPRARGPGRTSCCPTSSRARWSRSGSATPSWRRSTRRIIMADSSAFGPTGPWSARMGYGPLVRASSGLTDLWRYPDDEGSYSDATTIYPDHVGARVSAVAVLAKLIERRRTGRGGAVSVAQAETILGELRRPRSPWSRWRRAPSRPAAARCPPTRRAGAYPCAGDDEWVVVTVRGDADFAALAGALGQPELAAAPGVRDRGTAGWRARADRRRRCRLDAVAVAPRGGRALQAAGVPAGRMLRISEHLSDPHLVHAPLPDADAAPAAGRAGARRAGQRGVRADARARRWTRRRWPGSRPASWPRGSLGLSDPEIQSLVDAGILEEPPPVPAGPPVPPVPPVTVTREPS